MDEASIEQAILVSQLSKFPVEIDRRWAVWNDRVITKKMVLGVLTKLHQGPLPNHLQEVLLKDYIAHCQEVPDKFTDLPRVEGTYYNFHTREHVKREYPETCLEWFNRIYYNIFQSMAVQDANALKVVLLDNDYKKQVIERIFLSE